MLTHLPKGEKMPQTAEEFANLAELYDVSLMREKHYNSLLRSTVDQQKQKINSLKRQLEKTNEWFKKQIR